MKGDPKYVMWMSSDCRWWHRALGGGAGCLPMARVETQPLSRCGRNVKGRPESQLLLLPGEGVSVTSGAEEQADKGIGKRRVAR